MMNDMQIKSDYFVKNVNIISIINDKNIKCMNISNNK